MGQEMRTPRGNGAFDEHQTISAGDRQDDHAATGMLSQAAYTEAIFNLVPLVEVTLDQPTGGWRCGCAGDGWAGAGRRAKGIHRKVVPESLPFISTPSRPLPRPVIMHSASGATE